MKKYKAFLRHGGIVEVEADSVRDAQEKLSRLYTDNLEKVWKDGGVSKVSKVYEDKRKFVENELNACLKAANIGVDHLEYHKRAPDSPEIVTICFIGGGRRTVNVSGDSKLAIISDVLRWGEF